MAANSWLPLLYGGIVLDASNIIFQSLQKKVTTDHSFASSWLTEICSDISSMFKKHGKSHL